MKTWLKYNTYIITYPAICAHKESRYFLSVFFESCIFAHDSKGGGEGSVIPSKIVSQILSHKNQGSYFCNIRQLICPCVIEVLLYRNNLIIICNLKKLGDVYVANVQFTVLNTFFKHCCFWGSKSIPMIIRA